MIPFYRISEVIAYSVLNSVPFLLLAIYAFRRHLRFSKNTTVMLILLFCVPQMIIGYFAAFDNVSTRALSGISTVICALFCFLIIKDRFGRLFFVLLFLANVANLLTVLAKCMESLIFGNMAMEPYRWSLSLCLLVMHLLFTLPFSFYVHKYYTGGIPIRTTAWSYLWIAPATFYLLWEYYLYFTGTNSLYASVNVHSALFLLLINLGSLVVFHMAIMLLKAQQQANVLTQQNHQLSIHKLQYENLQQRINEARQARHDVHHHTHLIREYLRSGKLKELENYLDSYSASLPKIQPVIYCRHYATNALIGYFAQQASSLGIEMDVFVQLPEEIALPETTLSVVLGNLIENAMDACAEMTSGKKYISIRGKASMNSIFFEIVNTYSGKLVQNEQGLYRSSKSKHRGIGLESVAQIAKTYGGVLEFDAQEDRFRVSILLPEQTVPQSAADGLTQITP